MQATFDYAERSRYDDIWMKVYRLNPDGSYEYLFYTGLIYAGGFIKDFPDLGISVAVFPGGYGIPGAQPIGRYFFDVVGAKNGAEVESIGLTDVITVVGNLDGFLKIEWWDDEDFYLDSGDVIVYDGHGTTGDYARQTTFRNEVYLKADIAKPEYIFEEEGETRDGYFFPIKMISEKRFRFSFMACEYLLDAMRFIRMADHIQITYRDEVYNCDSFLMTPEWEKEGDLAAVQCEFETATVAKKIGVGYLRARNAIQL